MGDIILYHGSIDIIERPEFGKGKPYNDYGRGFYCTEHIELAKEWACTESDSGIVNKYKVKLDGLKILNLSDDKYNILNWLAVLLDNRKIRLSTPVMKRGKDYITENYHIDINSCDIIIGYRADDSYFSFARAFISNQISLEQLSYAMRLGNLGEQYMIKSKKAFNHIKYVSYEAVDREYFEKRKSRDSEARAKYESELENADVNGTYIRDLIRGDVNIDDLRI